MSEREGVGSDVRAKAKNWRSAEVSKWKVMVWGWELGEGGESQMGTWHIYSRLRVQVVGDWA